MEDDLKILKVEYLPRPYLYLPQLLNIRTGSQIENCCESRQRPIEDDLKILKVENLSTGLQNRIDLPDPRNEI
jgi:hypothetical protein